MRNAYKQSDEAESTIDKTIFLEDIVALLLAIVSKVQDPLDTETEDGHEYEADDLEDVLEVDILLLGDLRLRSRFNTIHIVIGWYRQEFIR